MQKRSAKEIPLPDLKVQFPPINELIERAERLTDSCVHPDQVTVTKNFVLNVARRAWARKLYSETDLMRIATLVDHMASRKARRITAGGEPDSYLN